MCRIARNNSPVVLRLAAKVNLREETFSLREETFGHFKASKSTE